MPSTCEVLQAQLDLAQADLSANQALLAVYQAYVSAYTALIVADELNIYSLNQQLENNNCNGSGS